MNSFIDKFSSFCNAAFDLLLVKHPTRTSLGIVLGLSISFLVDLFSPVLSRIEYIDLTKISPWGWLPVGILIAHSPLFIWHLLHRPIFNEEVTEVLVLINKGGFSQVEKRQQYRLLINKVLENVILKKETQKKLGAIQSKLHAASDEEE